MKSSLLPFLLLLAVLQPFSVQSQKAVREYYDLTIYHFKDAAQEQILDRYLKEALLPALHRRQIRSVGAFKHHSNDTTADKRLYVLIPVKSPDAAHALRGAIATDPGYLRSGQAYLQAPHHSPAYVRMENIQLYAFPLAPRMSLPDLKGDRRKRIYELRSYESATENLHVNKVAMFNEGGEIDFFKRLEFNATFYAQVIAGPRMPNLMYMTTFEDMPDRNAHWKTFMTHPFWKELSSKPEYQNNVNKVDIDFLYPTEYSDY